MRNLLALGLLCTLLLGCSDNKDTFDASSGNVGTADSDKVTRIALGEAQGWAYQAKGRDAIAEHRPRDIDCDEGEGWLIEDGAIEVRTAVCNYLSLTQESLVNIPAGTVLELVLSHSELVFSEAAQAHIALSIAGNLVYENYIDIPADSLVLRENIVLDFDVEQRDAIELHLHNHGSNAWTIHSLEAVIEGEFNQDEFCATYDSTFAAIQGTVFEQADCTNSQCHSAESAAGNLDLSADAAYDSLVGVTASASDELLVSPRNPSSSFLYKKLAAKTKPGSYDVAGSPMPAGGDAISVGQLEAIRLWIEAGAPETGSVGDTLGRGEDELERLLGVCLPEPVATNVIPLLPPAADVGVQFRMPAHAVPAESERELCFAVYEDFRDQIPAQYLSEDGNAFYVHGDEKREDPYTHHNVLMYSGVPTEEIHDPSFGQWSCAGGDFHGQSCEPTDTQSCGTGQCRSEVKDSVACRGYGPGTGLVAVADGIQLFAIGGGPKASGFYEAIPAHGIFYWNSHAFNLTTEDAQHNVWHNLTFADDRRYQSGRVAYSPHIWAGAGTAPFTRNTVCREFTLDQGDAVLEISSHTHKRGEEFTVALKGQEDDPFYTTRTYDEPLLINYDPPWEFNQVDADSRTLVYCATYNNGLNPDDSFNLDTVTRASLKPVRSYCRPTACAAGNIGASCAGRYDDSSCNSSPGSGDGFCDACPISAGVTSDDEMFILLVTRSQNFAQQLVSEEPSLEISAPTAGASFAPGETFTLALELDNFMLVPPESHAGDHTGDHDASMGDDMDSQGMDDHGMNNGDHSQVNMGHYHVYLHEPDDDAPHVTNWEPTIEYTLPEDITPGGYILRVNLRAPDHHALGIEDQVIILVE